MFKWFRLSNFMDTYQEWHAFVEGFCRGFLVLFCWLDRYPPNDELTKDIQDEHHYFVSGLVTGFICFVLFGIGVYKLV